MFDNDICIRGSYIYILRYITCFHIYIQIDTHIHSLILGYQLTEPKEVCVTKGKGILVSLSGGNIRDLFSLIKIKNLKRIS
jgi:hypothetical protein